MRSTSSLALAPILLASAACIPPGNAPKEDAGTPTFKAPPAQAPTAPPGPPAMTTVFEDSFERAPAPQIPPALLPMPADARADVSPLLVPAPPVPPAMTSSLGPDWRPAQTNAWRLENGWLCGSGARNHGVWLNRVLPTNARIEFDAKSDSPDGDLKAEVWGDGQSAATGVSYTNATSYIVIFGGWKNTFHVLARINEHGTDRKEIRVDPHSDDFRERPVARGQIYHFKIERTDGRTVRWFVDGQKMLEFADEAPLAGPGHDHFGFNDWEVKVCFDNVRVTPL